MHPASTPAPPPSPNKPRLMVRLFQAGLALLMLAILIAFIAGVSRSLALKTTAYLLLAIGSLCLGAASLVANVKPMLQERRDPDGVPAEVPIVVADLASKAGIAIPRTKVIRNRAPNARASFFRGPSLVINRGLVDSLSPFALIGTMGHEIGHIISGHLTGRQRILPLSWLALLVGTCLLCVLWKAGAVSITWPVYAAVATAAVWPIVAAVSRRHEFEADRAGAHLTGVDAQFVALDELERYERTRDRRPRLRKAGQLIATHPTYAERKAALHSIATGEEG